MEKQLPKKQQLKLTVGMASFCLVLIIVTSSFSIAQKGKERDWPTPKTPRELTIPPSLFTTQGGNEFILNTEKPHVIDGVPSRDGNGVDLSRYDLEFSFRNANGKRVQLWYKDSSWKNVYSYPYTIQNEQPIRYNPFKNGRNVDEFNDFTHIYAIGAKVLGGLQGIQIRSVRLIRRD